MRMSRSDEQGETLVELVISIALLGLAVAVLLGALATSITASASHRRHATADTVARSFAEALSDPDPASGTPYANCATSYALPGYLTVPSGFDTPTTAVAYWNPGATKAEDSDFSSTGCTQENDRGLQRVTITVRSSTNGEQSVVSILKRRGDS